MKNFTFLVCLAICLIYFACNKKSKEELLSSSTKNELLYNMDESSILMYHQTDKKFYLIQSNNLPAIKGRMFISRVGKNFIDVI